MLNRPHPDFAGLGQIYFDMRDAARGCCQKPSKSLSFAGDSDKTAHKKPSDNGNQNGRGLT